MSGREVSHRMRLAHPDAFEPRVVLFSDYPTENQKDWIDSFALKAAAVYSAVFGRDAVVHDHDNMSFHLLVSLAKSGRHPGSSLQGEVKKQGDDNLEMDILPIEAAQQQEPKEDEIERLPKEIKQRIDAVYLVVGFLGDIFFGAVEDRQKLDRYAVSKHGRDIISDLAMLENQVPLHLLFDVATNIRHGLVTAYEEQLLINKNNIVPGQEYWRLNQYPISRIDEFSISSSDELVSLFCWYYSPFYSAKRKVLFGKKKWEKKERHLLGCLHSALLPKATTTARGTGGILRQLCWVTPTATELSRAGVRFEPDPTGEVRIGFSDAVLSLPVLFFDSKLQTVVLNLVAMERKHALRSTPPSKPIVTRYFQFMKELVDDLGDVRLLSFASSYSSPYPPMDVAIEEMKEFYKKQMSKFVVKHRPVLAVLLSTVAAASLLLGTAVFTSKKRPSLLP
ncbi:hypothetical protein H6P81_014357 [Aristolochia fimbriata]|uniref:Uncharacterized protein n=1 Tax=Aristolochia fimbriata TaxID=158543 RepID=A0AAV7EHM2_ARIFI|nr:hypothetical protein H6P81_014357 [Aristolochia fimbriata]